MNTETLAEANRAWLTRVRHARWSSPTARDEVMSTLQPNDTVSDDCSAWVKAVVLGVTRRVLPIALDAVGLRAEAGVCRGAENLIAAHKATEAAALAASETSETDDDAGLATVLAGYAATYTHIATVRWTQLGEPPLSIGEVADMIGYAVVVATLAARDGARARACANTHLIIDGNDAAADAAGDAVLREAVAVGAYNTTVLT